MSQGQIQPRRSARLASRYMQDEDDEFHLVVIEYFKRYTRFSLEADGIECIRRSQRHFSKYLGDKLLATMYMDVIFAVFEVFRVTDTDVIRNSLEEYILLILHRSGKLMADIEPPSLFRRFPRQNIRYEMFGFVKEFSIQSFFFHPSRMFPSFETKILLRHGVPFDMDESDVQGFQNIMLKPILEGTNFGVFTWDEMREIHTLVSERYPTLADKKRLYFILMQIYIVTLKEIEKTDVFELYEDANRSLTVIYESIPDPLITVKEVVRFFEITLRSKFNESSVSEFRKLFVENFPLSDADIEPRTLEHLSRCRVRKCLMQSTKLPHGVWSLKIPKPLQNYILMEKETEDQPFTQLVHELAPKRRWTSDIRRSKRLKKSQQCEK